MSDRDIRIGLTGWGDHYSLYETPHETNRKLHTYAGYFPVVELDASFYAIPAQKTVEKWIADTPASFQFIVKAYQGITGHQRGEIPYTTKKEMFTAFEAAFKPLQEAGKLGAVLCQFPPWFDVRKEHIDYLRAARAELSAFDTALEFRHQSWFTDQYREKTLDYMIRDQWIHSICDEPQAGEKSVPFVPVATDENKTVVRLHGRNIAGWNSPASGEDWRAVRYLYDYSSAELDQLSADLTALNDQSSTLYVLFNNNSGGHAAANALDMISKLQLQYTGLAPKQIDLFFG
ncbi:DUF72 domain-containing protein [Salisediminibacterium halotolerans]|uniref:DUF72 domain-containing protein n=1 Tax=Salisediminibacterium halotolerans TaxID=517425 RepID=UPI000EAFE3CB|nr:DUF72 domain-containing protein [Salisediminibacterium halotolerans]RLJ75403.1 uncharacterized protein YecE (DUF72 family) [Actinophytocola xinjiangensis]RPE89257.1 uncharacterized protein YecE (DUF72 family) [Salisediminibacterium halotolerans]TWG36016.1 uncharacterized protein YecE (DUF72 family) [Salisediminibacterium halotolerans]GEL07810.1 UPF0759 protein YunF [Salisediminibacterium halotolerans]